MRGRALLTLTYDLDALTRQVGHGLLDSGHALDPATARRLGCDAGIVPTILGTRAEPLDIARLAYTVPDGIRRALHQRDRGCTFPGCTRRPAHHVIHWLDGGPTEINNSTLLCRYHHHVIHHSGWTITMINGRPWYTPPAWIDPTRTPRPGGVDTTLAG
jgi:hypothetical protein